MPVAAVGGPVPVVVTRGLAIAHDVSTAFVFEPLHPEHRRVAQGHPREARDREHPVSLPTHDRACLDRHRNPPKVPSPAPQERRMVTWPLRLGRPPGLSRSIGMISRYPETRMSNRPAFDRYAIVTPEPGSTRPTMGPCPAAASACSGATASTIPRPMLNVANRSTSVRPASRWSSAKMGC